MSRVDWTRIAELSMAGHGPVHIAAELGCSQGAVKRAVRLGCQRAGIDWDRVAALTRRGWTAGRIAEELGCSRRSVTRVRTKMGVGRPAPKFLTTEEIARLEDMLADGCSGRDIERTLGRAPGSLTHRLTGRAWTPSQAAEFAVFCRHHAR